MAIKVKDSKNIATSTHIQAQQDALINSKNLPLFPEDNITLKSDQLPLLKTRPYTYVPGHVAYASPSDVADSTVASTATAVGKNGYSSRSSNSHKKQQIPIILHSENRKER